MMMMCMMIFLHDVDYDGVMMMMVVVDDNKK